MISTNNLFTDPKKKKIVDYFYNRTNNHIDLVKKYIDKIYLSNPTKYKQLLSRKEIHDQSKYRNPELEPYIFLTWKYRCQSKGKNFKLPKEIENQIQYATFFHIKNNRHHPEFHDPNITEENINKKNRDEAPQKITDGTKMSDIDIAEMVADWMAMSEEKQTNPIDWADKNINIRWKFTNQQINQIYQLLNLF